jgi:hypothetical protein
MAGKIFPYIFSWLQLAKYDHSNLCNMILAPNEPPLAAKFGINNSRVVKTTF